MDENKKLCNKNCIFYEDSSCNDIMCDAKNKWKKEHNQENIHNKVDTQDDNNLEKRIITTCFMYLALSIFWMILEMLFYEEIQYRIVDEIISLPIIISFWCNTKNIK